MNSHSDPLRQIGEEITNLVGDGVDDERLRRQEKVLLAHLCAVSEPRKVSRYRLVGALAAACVLICGVVVLIGQLRQTPFSYWIDRDLEPGQEGFWLTATAGKTLPIRFEDGSTLDFVGPAAGQVQRSRAQQVTIALHHGRLTALVRSAKKRTWRVLAGPYQIVDLGTRFSTWWQAEQTCLEVLVYQGSVMVRGPGLPAVGMVLSSKERLFIEGANDLAVTREKLSTETEDLGRVPSKTGPDQLAPQPTSGQTQSTSLAPRPSLAPKGKKPRSGSKKRKGIKDGLGKHDSRNHGSTGPKAPGSGSSMVGYSGPSANSDAHKPSRWLALYRQGRYLDSIRQARAFGMEEILRDASLDELWKLAEAARYADRLQEAYQALQAVHRRFGGSAQGKMAAFLLGRLTMEKMDKSKEAIRWFQRYLKVDPNGFLAEEALGRWMDSCLRIGMRSQASELAERYLKRYPTGAFAQMAKSILQ